MAQRDHLSEEKSQEQVSERLQRSLDPLNQSSGGATGLSRNFSSQMETEETAMLRCEQSMQRLAENYVNELAAFKEETKPMAALKHLEAAESVWREEATVIRELDQDGEESQFLEEMRNMALMVMEERLVRAADVCAKNASPENVALCLALVGVVDEVWRTKGMPETDPLRRRLKQIATEFAD